jgi:dihydrolipoamide dehydrogenase
MTNAIKPDVLVIGTGSAGMNAYRAAKQHTSSVLVVESGPYGTTCARVGCMPSKLLIAAADRAHDVVTAGPFGLETQLKIDGVQVMKRVREERDRFVGFVEESVLSWPESDRLQGHARFINAHQVAVADQVIEPRAIVIATGSAPSIPAQWASVLQDKLIINDDVFNWTDLPKSVAVVGAGVIALELAQALHRLGVRVKILVRSQKVGSFTDPILKEKAKTVLSQELDFSFEATDILPKLVDDQVQLSWISQNKPQQETFDYLLCAIGRTPNLAELNLEATGLYDPTKKLNVNCETGYLGQNIFMAGDVTGFRPLLHEASDEGQIAGSNAACYPSITSKKRRTALSVVFSDPQMALVGQTYEQLLQNNTAFKAGDVSFDNQGRSRVMLKNKGHMRVYADANNQRLLGAEILGPAAEHLGHLLAWSIQAGLTVQDTLDCPFYHPVIEEGLRTALRELAQALG